MKQLFYIIIIIINKDLFSQEKSFGQIAISKFLSENIDEAEFYSSKAIQDDSLNYTNFYIRGVLRLYLNDTINAISDFDNAIRLKKHNGYLGNDSLINFKISGKPKRSNRICGPDRLPFDLHEIMLGSWLALSEEANNLEACKTFKTIEGIKLKKLLQRVCE